MTLPLVLLHAFPITSELFDGVVDRLPELRVIRPDLRGFGAAPDPDDDEPDVDRYADDVAAALDRAEVERAVVAGLSLGGYVTMAMLRRHPDRVAGVILMDTKASADSAEARANRERIAAAVLEHGTRALRPMLDTLLGETTRQERPDVVARVTGWLDGARPDGVAWAQRAMAARPASFDTLRAASAAGVPGAVVVGSEDTLTGQDDATAMARAFQPAAPVHVIPAAGHLSAVENPEPVATALRAITRAWEDLDRT